MRMTFASVGLGCTNFNGNSLTQEDVNAGKFHAHNPLMIRRRPVEINVYVCSRVYENECLSRSWLCFQMLNIKFFEFSCPIPHPCSLICFHPLQYSCYAMPWHRICVWSSMLRVIGHTKRHCATVNVLKFVIFVIFFKGNWATDVKWI